MEGNPHPSHSPTPSGAVSGGLIHLQARLTSPTIWLIPAWALLCGIAASNGFSWQRDHWLRLALLILLVDAGWGTLWAALGSTDWAKPLRRWRNWHFGEPSLTLPYTIPGTPGDRLSRWLGQLRAWWRDILWPSCGPAVSAIVIAFPVTLLLATLLGPKMLLLSLAAVTVMELGLIWAGGRGAVAPTWNALVALMLPWLAGHIAFDLLSPSSTGLALALALAWAGSLCIESLWGRVLGVGGQLLAAILLVALHRPLAACAMVLLLVPQLALFPWVARGQSSSWYTRRGRLWLMATMLVAAAAL
jgi:hypothetical protein